MLKSTLLATKFHLPKTPTRWVERPNLLRKLNEGLDLERRLTLVSAPAGFGKTACIGHWLSNLHGWTIAWLSLDDADDDPGLFFSCFIAALQKIEQNLCSDLASILASAQVPPRDIFSTALINELAGISGRCLLVLDDFHVIQDEYIIKVFEKLMPNLPPRLHLVLISREDPPLPLAQMRAQNRLTEIRVHDLRFSHQNATNFLNRMMGLSLSEEDVARLQHKTEGWVVGLQLAALSLDGQDRSSELIDAFSGSHRFILTYLAEQVLDRQPDDIRQFLMQTSILDKLNVDLCNAVTERSDSHSMIERLLNANLFLTALDDRQQWYRFHHLFADLLREIHKNTPSIDLAERHQRACRWYSGEGMVHQAMRHALAVKDFDTSVTLLEKHAMDMVMQGYARTVNGWLEEIPQEWRSQSHRINLAFVWMHMLQGSYSQIPPYMDLLKDGLSTPQMAHISNEETASLKAEWLVLRSLMLIMQEEIPDSLAAAEQALHIVPEDDERVKSLAFFALASIFSMQEDYPHAVDMYQRSIRAGRDSKNPFAEMMSLVGLTQMAYEHGDLSLALELSEPIRSRIERSEALPPIHAVVYGVLADVHYQRYLIEDAFRYIQHTLRMSQLGGYNTGIIFCHVYLSRLAKLQGDSQSAAREIQNALEHMAGKSPAYVQQEIIAQQVHVHLMRDNPAAARMVLQEHGFSLADAFSYPIPPLEHGFSHSIGLLYNASLHLVLHLAKKQDISKYLDTAIALAGRLIEAALKGQYKAVAIETYLLRARLYGLSKREPSAISSGHCDQLRALELGQPENFLAVFIEQCPEIAAALADIAADEKVEFQLREHAHRIIDLHTIEQSPAVTRPARDAAESDHDGVTENIIAALTEREVDVIRLMSQGLKYAQIADRLFISLNTVRYHVKSVYGKLNANNRTQAIEIARRLHIL